MIKLNDQKDVLKKIEIQIKLFKKNHTKYDSTMRVAPELWGLHAWITSGAYFDACGS